ncbi:MAG: hypothetical protein ACXWPI_16280 [Ktedonobacterales bacterium]
MPQLLTVEGARRNMEKCWQEYAAYTAQEAVDTDVAHRLYAQYLDALERYRMVAQLAGIGRRPARMRNTRLIVALVAIGLIVALALVLWLVAGLGID